MNQNNLKRLAQQIVTIIVISNPLSATAAFASSFGIDKMYIFGDSLSDTGNFSNIFYNMTGTEFPPDPFYSDGRFTNGNVWNQDLENQLGVKNTTQNFYQAIIPNQGAKASPNDPLNHGLNWAVGGSKSGFGHLNPAMNCSGGDPNCRSVGLLGQINEYTNLLNGTNADPNALFIVWSAANDYVDPTTIPNPEESVNNLLTALTTLAEAGAKKIVIANLPNLGEIPGIQKLGQETVDYFNFLTASHNQLLANEIDKLEDSFQDTTFIDLDVNHLFKKILDNPTQANFVENAKAESCTNITDFPVLPNLDDFEVCDDPNKYFFYDNQHPTKRVHKIIANYAFKEVRDAISDPSSGTIPEPSTVGTLGLLGFGLLWQMKQKKHK